MNIEKKIPIIRLATADDAMPISFLYQQVYAGHYPNPLMRDIKMLQDFLNHPLHVWVIVEDKNRVVGSAVYEMDDINRLARVFGGAVLDDYRGLGLLEKAMIYGQKHLMEVKGCVDVIYATTRTSSPAPQVVTEKLGYAKLGIFPNVHRTDTYETHGLVALFNRESLQMRYKDFYLHPSIARLFNIVKSECQLEDQQVATDEMLHLDDFRGTKILELIQAEHYVLERFESQKAEGLLQAHFYPFHTPNCVITSPCQTIEVFVYTSAQDKYSTIIGVKKPREFHFTWLLDECAKLLQNAGVRYLELLVRIDKVKTIERVVRSRFIPCAIFPAFQLQNQFRYDFVVFSRTFEFVDFKGLKLSGKNRIYLDEYIENLEKFYLRPPV